MMSMDNVIIEFTHPIGEYALLTVIGIALLLSAIVIGNAIYGFFKKTDPNDHMW